MTSQAVQSVHLARSFTTFSGEAVAKSENIAPPGHTLRQKPARETKVSKKNASTTPAEAVVNVPKQSMTKTSRPMTLGG